MSRTSPAMPMVRCASCDAPNVTDRDTCWRCLRDLDAEPAESTGPAQATEPARPVRRVQPAEPAPAAEAALPVAPVPVAVQASTEITLSTRVPPRIVLSPWPTERRARRGRGRYLVVASIAILLVVGIVGVAFLNLAVGGAKEPERGSGSDTSGPLAAAVVTSPIQAASEPDSVAASTPVAEPTRASEPDPTDRPSGDARASQVVVIPEGTAATGDSAGRAARGNAFTCGDADHSRIRDLRDRTWRVTKVSFQALSGFERVILHLERIGEARPGRGTVAIAGRVSTEELEELPSDVHPERKRRGLLRIALPGVSEGPEIRAFRPLGIGNIGELSLLPGRNGRTALLAVDHDACYRVRVPEWGASGAEDARRAEVVIDIRD